jgi:hypothetical protein
MLAISEDAMYKMEQQQWLVIIEDAIYDMEQQQC